MKITNDKAGTNLSRVDTTKSSSVNKRENTAGALGVRDNAATSGAAQVNVSERAQMMQKAKEIASRPDTIDEAKVARLQKLIDEGKYKVDAQAIADRLVDEHLATPD